MFGREFGFSGSTGQNLKGADGEVGPGTQSIPARKSGQGRGTGAGYPCLVNPNPVNFHEPAIRNTFQLTLFVTCTTIKRHDMIHSAQLNVDEDQSGNMTGLLHGW